MELAFFDRFHRKGIFAEYLNDCGFKVKREGNKPYHFGVLFGNNESGRNDLSSLNTTDTPPFFKDCDMHDKSSGGLFVLREFLIRSEETRELIQKISDCWILFFDQAFCQLRRGVLDLPELYANLWVSFPDFKIQPSWMNEYVVGLSLYLVRQVISKELFENYSYDSLQIAQSFLKLLNTECAFFASSKNTFVYQTREGERINIRDVWIWSWSPYDYSRRTTFLLDPIHRRRHFTTAQLNSDYLRSGLRGALRLSPFSLWEGVGFPSSGKTSAFLLADFLEHIRGAKVISNDELELPLAAERRKTVRRGHRWERSSLIQGTWTAWELREGELRTNLLLRTLAKAMEVRDDILDRLMPAIERQKKVGEVRVACRYDTGPLASLVGYQAEIVQGYLKLDRHRHLRETLLFSPKFVCSEEMRSVIRDSIVYSGILLHISDLLLGEAVFLDLPTAVIRDRIPRDTIKERRLARSPFLEDFRLELLRWITYELSDIFWDAIHVVPAVHATGSGIASRSSYPSVPSCELRRRLEVNRANYRGDLQRAFLVQGINVGRQQGNDVVLLQHTQMQNAWNIYWVIAFDEVANLYVKYFNWPAPKDVSQLIGSISEVIGSLSDVLSTLIGEYGRIHRAIPALLDETDGVRIEQRRKHIPGIFKDL